MKYRYLPPASNAGDTASDMPSVTCVALPFVIEYRKIALIRLSRFFEYASHRESGDQTWSKVRPGSAKFSTSILDALPAATSIDHSVRWLSWNAMRLPSGDHDSAEKNDADGKAIARGLDNPD